MSFKKLYVRIWLAVVLAVAVLTFLVGWAWRLAVEPPLTDVVVRNEAGQIIGNGHARRRRPPGTILGAMIDGERGAYAPSFGLHDQYGNGPEFVVLMLDGDIVHLELPRPPRSFWSRAPFGFFWTLALVGIAVALATYPIVRKLTRRLELLQDGVEKWGSGDLSIRVPEGGQDEVGFLATRFNHAAERIETLVKSHEALLASQRSLLANASHELRSPLARIRMGLELMGGPIPGGPGAVAPQTAPAWKDEISRNIGELDQLIEEILLASRLDAREADLGTIEAVDLVGLVAEECSRVDAEFDVQELEAGTHLQVPQGVSTWTAQGVTKLLRRAVRNLLENARRYGAGQITVQLRQTQGRALIEVADRGPGIPPELTEHIFEPFYRLPGASERDGGVGLGLALVKSIAIRHGGAAYCENRPDGGARFVIELPLSGPESVQAG